MSFSFVAQQIVIDGAVSTLYCIYRGSIFNFLAFGFDFEAAMRTAETKTKQTFHLNLIFWEEKQCCEIGSAALALSQKPKKQLTPNCVANLITESKSCEAIVRTGCQVGLAWRVPELEKW